jgi:hypothetical protein
MIKLGVRVVLVAVIAAAGMYGCGDDSVSPGQPNRFGVASQRTQSECGEITYLSSLSPVLTVWEDSIETFLADTVSLDVTPVFAEGSTVAGYLNALVPVLQQWETAINSALAGAVLDTVPDFDPAVTHRQGYLSGLSSLLVSWKVALETERGTVFLPDPPVFQPDETAPVITCAQDTTITCADSAGVVVAFEVTAVDDCDPAPILTCEPPSGSVFPPGATDVTCTAVDSSGNTSTCTFTVNVEEKQPLVVVGATASPSVLWPPNHKWVDVRVSVNVEDACDSTASCTIVDVTSNEPVNGNGDGNTDPDWMITGGPTVKLRAERAGGGDGRIYTVRFRCENESGEAVEGSVNVVVPHDQSGK